jgi:CPA1 family monovalent cation:H+ antiporter
MNAPDLFVAMLAFLCVLALLAQRARIAYPIAFLLGGIALGFLPHLPAVTVPPQYMLTIFLPPLIMEAAYSTSWRDFKFNLRPILQLSVGLVVLTALAVAWLFERLIPGGGWILGFVLGAIISPPDAVAASAIVKRLNVPKRIITVLEGESLLNDATGLILYQVAVGAIVLYGLDAGQTQGFSLLEMAQTFTWMVIFGLGVGLSVGHGFMRLFPKLREPSVEVVSSFIVPYISYLLAEAGHGSGVLAVVCTGIVVGWHAPGLLTPEQRLQSEAVWRTVTFLLNGVVFLLIGLSFPSILNDLSDYSLSTLLTYAAEVCGVIVVTRLVYVFVIAYGTRFLFRSILKRDPYPAWQNVFVIGWTGMRGVVSLATALALPLALYDGTPFPHRSLLIFLAFAVIVFTLVAQGLSLPFLLRHLPLSFNQALLEEDWRARVAAALEALKHIEALPTEAASDTVRQRILSHYRDRLRALGDGPSTPLHPTEQPSAKNHPLVQAESRLWHDVLGVERRAVLRLRAEFKISDDAMHDMLRDLDLLQARFS